MLLALLIALTIPPPSPCGFAQTVKGLNLPANTTTADTEITHAAAVVYEGKTTGWLYETAKQWFYQDGPIGSGGYPRQSPEVAKVPLQALGLVMSAHPQEGAIYPLKQQLQLSLLIGKSVEIKGCY